MFTSQTKWSEKDGHWNASEFMVAMLKIAYQYPRWKKDLLVFWNE